MFFKETSKENLLTRYWVNIVNCKDVPNGTYGIEIDKRSEKAIRPNRNLEIVDQEGLPVYERIRKEFLKSPLSDFIKTLK